MKGKPLRFYSIITMAEDENESFLLNENMFLIY